MKIYRPIFKCKMCNQLYISSPDGDTENVSLLPKETTHKCNKDARGICELVGYREIDIDYSMLDYVGW